MKAIGRLADIVLTLSIAFAALAFMMILSAPFLLLSEAVSQERVITQINITNAPPTVDLVELPTTLTLEANSTVELRCNATVSDINGQADIVSVNATFFDPDVVLVTNADDNRTHYTNSSCDNFTVIDGDTRRYSCLFSIQYWANPGQWVCNATANDTGKATAFGNTTTTINDLIALSTPSMLDFGDTGVSNITDNTLFNISNAGNKKINITIAGFGNQSNDTLAMVCAQGNISWDNQRFTTNVSNITAPYDFNAMKLVNNSEYNATLVANFTIDQRNMTAESATNTTLWRVNVVPVAGGPYGICNGTLVINAVDAFP